MELDVAEKILFVSRDESGDFHGDGIFLVLGGDGREDGVLGQGVELEFWFRDFGHTCFGDCVPRRYASRAVLTRLPETGRGEPRGFQQYRNKPAIFWKYDGARVES